MLDRHRFRRSEDDPRRRRDAEHARLRAGPGRRRHQRQRGQRRLTRARRWAIWRPAARPRSLKDWSTSGSTAPICPPTGWLRLRLPVDGRLAVQTARPSHNNEDQGELGDCYLISSLGTIADSSPAAIQNMFIDNGDGTWTVRFYDNGDGRLRDRQQPSAGHFAAATDLRRLRPMYTNSTSTSLDPAGREGLCPVEPDGQRGPRRQNTYSGIEGGWMADVDAQVLGHAAASYMLPPATSRR